MNIRSVTCFVNAGDPSTQAATIQAAGQLAREAGAALEAAGFPVQTRRLATQPLSHLPGDPLQPELSLGHARGGGSQPGQPHRQAHKQSE